MLQGGYLRRSRLLCRCWERSKGMYKRRNGEVWISGPVRRIRTSNTLVYPRVRTKLRSDRDSTLRISKKITPPPRTFNTSVRKTPTMTKRGQRNDREIRRKLGLGTKILLREKIWEEIMQLNNTHVDKGRIWNWLCLPLLRSDYNKYLQKQPRITSNEEIQEMWIRKYIC